ncbi:helix-turn-helix domain-containing protein [Chelatococcus reniformis]|uniref:AraC family transcriptional regulator n=1 Tax=Chelatococcus reniformis TaxID=1494448 RepID=A0A916UP36_9HYPH|nr:AraC family transcriptional regulator [Chelatococcus reniformis]GGC81310.1 AraC family transcriptional regulator [Chelatococcus reniformis]
MGSIIAHALAEGPGWRAFDVVCTAGPHDRPYEECHEGVCVAAVIEGTFRYGSSQGAATLAPGALLLGNPGSCFRCGHEHGAGDRCVSFQFTPHYWEGVLADMPGARRFDFAGPRLPPLPQLAAVVAHAASALENPVDGDVEELGLRLAGAAVAIAHACGARREPSARDRGRVADTLRMIARRCHEPLSVGALAAAVAMTPYHFLRTFRHVVGVTPHQYVLRSRLHRAAMRIRRTEESVSAIAFDEGFGDLSTFNRRFRKLFGVSPTGYRQTATAAPSASVPSRWPSLDDR